MVSRRFRPFWRLGLVAAIALGHGFAAAPAIADPTREDRAAALALFDEGRKLAGDKKFADACPKFEAAMRLDPGMGILFNLSDCYEQIGRTASAWSGFRDVASQARSTNQPDKEKVARDRVTALENKLSRVRIMVPADIPLASLTITRDGSPVPSALVGTPVPFDPGAHTIRVVAEGKEPWETKITVAAQGGTTDVQVPPLAAKKPDTAAPTATTSASTAPSATGSAAPFVSPTSSASADTGAAPRPWQKPLGITATAVGVVGVGVGVVFGVLAKGAFDDSNKSDCIAATNTCNDAGLKTRAGAVDQGNIGTAIGVAGAVVGAAGLALWIFAPSAPSPAKPAALTNVHLGAGPSGIVVRGRF